MAFWKAYAILIIFFTYLASLSDAEWWIAPISVEQGQDYRSHFGRKIPENYEMDTKLQMQHVSLLKGGNNAGGKEPTLDRNRRSVNHHDETQPWSSNVRIRRDTGNHTDSENSTGVSTESLQMTNVSLFGAEADKTTVQTSGVTQTTVQNSTGIETTVQTSGVTQTTIETSTGIETTVQTSGVTQTTIQTSTGIETTTPALTVIQTTTPTSTVTKIPTLTSPRGIGCPKVSEITIDETDDENTTIHWTLEPRGVRPQNACVAIVSVNNNACQSHEQCLVDPGITFKTVTNLCYFNEYKVTVFVQCVSGLWSNKTDTFKTKTSIPSPPTDLKATDVTNTTISLKWSPPFDPNGYSITQYSVYWESSYPGSSNTSETSCLLEKLEPFTYYNVSVSAWNSAGESKEKAGPLTLQTTDGIPDPPANITVLDFSNETLTLEWSSPSISKGIISNFSVYWKKSDSKEDFQSRVTEAHALKLENLKPYTNYSLKASAWTSAGEGPTSEELTQQTKEGIPSEPKDLKETDITNTSIAIKWSPPNSPNGEIVNYTVYLDSDRASNTTDTFYTLKNLQPYTDYNVSVSAWTSAGESSSKAGPLHLQTRDGIPGPPENVRIQDFSNETLTLEWSPPSVSKGVINSFTVYWKKSDSSEPYQSTSTKECMFKLENLKPYTNYTLKVSGWTSAGEGPTSEDVTQLTKEGIPGPPMGLKIQNGTDTDVILKWSPPNEKNGIIIKYQVSWSNSSDDSNVHKDTDVTREELLEIHNLNPYTNYTFIVSAFTVAGKGPPSQKKRYQTDAGAPSSPKNVFVDYRGPYVLSLRWDKPGQPRGPIDGYIIELEETEQSLKKKKQVFDTKNGEVETYKIEDLTPFTNYTISVVSYNINRKKEVLKSEDTTVQVQTSEGTPSAPKNVAINAFTNTTLSATWLSPETPNGIVEVYTVYCTSMEDGENRAPVNITDTKYVISNLLPFSEYNIAISATTVAGEGPKSQWITRKTDVGVPSRPVNVFIVDYTDTSIFVQWMMPEFQRGPIDGFYMNCRKMLEERTDESVTEYRDDFSISVTDYCDNYNAISSQFYNDSFITVTICRYQFSHLDPWTNYIIEIKAYNEDQRGEILQGFPEVIKHATAAAVPEPPILQPIDVLSSTAVSVHWLYEGRYPGPTSYAVELETNANYSCNIYDRRNITVQDGTQTSNITELTPYTMYYFQVFASTEAGSSSSLGRSLARTMPDVPDPPMNLKANCHDSPNKVSLTWRTPYWENGLIEEYKIRYRPKSGGFSYKDEVKEVDQPKFCDPREYHFELRNLVPERDYEIVVMAKTKDVKSYGKAQRYPQSCILPAGVPPFPKNDSVPEGIGTTPEEAQVAFSKNLFSSEMGEIRYYAIIVAFWDKIEEATQGNMSKARDENLPFWNDFRKQESEFYQATPQLWNPFQDKDYDPLHCQRKTGADEELLYCTIGWEKNCSAENPTYCNGPLIPGKRYGIKLRGFTRGGYSETNPIFIETAAIPHKSPVGVIVGLVFVFLLALLVAGAVFVDKKNNFRTLNRLRNLLRKKENRLTQQNVDIQLNGMGGSESGAKSRPMDFPSFLEHVKVMMSDSYLRFSLEYEEIKQNSPKHSCTAAEMEENRIKNRWMNIFPFDHSRVKLLPIDDEPSSDYINANYIPGYSSHREYIATQGPLPNTVDDFWRMIWEQSVTMIVMLTQCVERGKKKCEQYWPIDSENVYYGDLKIQLKSESILSGYCIRIFDLQLGSRQRTVKQMHFSKWPDFGSPESPNDLINFVQAVRDHLPHTNTGPMVVHCSAGVGRTGTFIAVDRLLQHIQFHNDINIYNTVVDMREHRTNMVQTEDQYIYIHKCMRDIISQRLHPRTSIYDEEDSDELYSNINAQQATEL